MVDPNWRWEIVEKIIPNLERKNRLVASGRTDDGIVYILIHEWTHLAGDPIQEVHRILEASTQTKVYRPANASAWKSRKQQYIELQKIT